MYGVLEYYYGVRSTAYGVITCAATGPTASNRATRTYFDEEVREHEALAAMCEQLTYELIRAPKTGDTCPPLTLARGHEDYYCPLSMNRY